RRTEDGTWSTPLNLGYPVNTHNEEVGFIVNARGDRAYYSTNRREGTDTDIYTFEMPPETRPRPVSYITGRVYDTRNMKGIMATFRLIDIKTGKLVTESVSAAGEGDYLLSLPTGSNYAFNVSHPGYLFYSDHFSLEKYYGKMDPLKKDIPLDPVSAGKMVVLNNIFYATDAYSLKEASVVELDKVLEFMKLNQGVGVEISGHTDNTGTAEYNKELSHKRAQEVVKYLISKGIDQSRLTARGYGDTVPVANNATEEGRAKNRRTELKILKVSK
ncbi:MAG: OmpA family protein, partial [Bacteroidales bacterium]|nr:OmpA family protein [Bacteroidales bacterium]